MLYKKRLIDLKEKYNLKQYEIAKILKLAPSTYNNYELEYEIIPIKHLNTLCLYFNISFDYIFDFTNNMNYKLFKNEINNELSAKRLKEFRQKHKLNQISLATFLNVSQSTISKIENGHIIIATPFLYQICKKYNISADYLLGKIDSPKYLN